MNTNAVNVAVVDAKTITQSLALRTGKAGEPVRIKAVQDGKYILAEDGEKGVAPENLTIKRVGQDLHVALEGADPAQPDLIIEGFFGSNGQLVGVAEDGAYYPYISADAQQDHSAAFLMDGVSSPQVLGSEQLTGFGDGLVAGSGIGWFWPALLGLGALGLLGGTYAAIHNSNKGGGHHDIAVAPDQPVLGGVEDNVGSIQGQIESGGTTDDNTPTFSGDGAPGNIITVIDNGKVIGEVVVGPDGTWEFTPPPLPDGSHNISITEKTPDGSESVPSEGHEIIIDTIAPGRTTIDEVIDDVGDVQGPVASGGVTDDNTPTLKGTAEAGSRVEIFANGEKIGEVIASAEGTWEFTTEPLANGSYSFTSSATDAAGNVGLPSLPHVLVVDAVVPGKPGAGTGGIDEAIDDVGPITGDIGKGGTTDDTTPTFGGSGLKPGETVTIFDNGVEIGKETVGADGTWHHTPNPALEDGTHSVTVTVTNEAGNTSESSDPYDVIVDSVAPARPTLDSVVDDQGDKTGPIAPGDTTDDSQLDLKGTAEPGSTVIIYDNGVEIGRAPVAADGSWTFTPKNPLANGTHSLTVEAMDAAGNISEATDPFDYTQVSDVTPGKPGVGTGGIDEAIDDVGPITGDIGNGGSTDDTTPTFGGSGLKPGETVTIFDNGVEIGKETVGADGTWHHTPNPALEDGTHSVTVTVTNKEGNTSEPSDPYDVIVDTVAPASPTLDSVVDDQGDKTGPITPGDTTDDSQLDLNGTGEPGSTVIIYDNGMEIGRAQVAADGSWAFTPANPLASGAHSLTVEAMDAAGNTSEATDPFDYIQASDVTPGKPGVGTGGIDEAIDDVGPITGDIGNGGSTDDTTPTFGGSGLKPGETVTIFDNGVEIGQETVGADGTWHHTPDPALEDGTHSVTVTVTNEAGNTSEASDPYDVIVDTVAPASPTLDLVVDDQGDKTGPIAPGDTTDDSQLDLKGTAEPGGTVIIYDNGFEIGRAPVAADGSWTFTPKNPLANGAHSLTVEAMDAAGNISEPTDPFDYNQLTGGAPPAPAITGVIDDVPEHEGNISPGGITNDSHPDIVGTAQAGSTVSIFDNGVLLGTVVADGAGNWSFTPKNALGEGNHDLTANATDDAGNTSPTTGVYPIIVDTVPPTAAEASELSDNVGPITDPIVSGMTTDDNTPTYHGKAEANTTLVIYDNGVEIGRVPVSVDGSWSFTPSPPLAEGAHSFSTVVIDEASNQSPESTPIDFTVDTSEVSISINQALDDVGPIQDPLASGGVTDDTTPTLTGSATPGSTVNIYLDGKLIQENVSVDASGKWTYTVSPALADGDYAFTATVVTAAGGESKPTQAFELEIDTTAPDKPIISDVNDDVGAQQGTVVDGGSTDDTTPTLSGSGAAGDVIIIRDNGKEIGREIIGKNGQWSFTPNPPLNNGTYVFSVVEQDKAGNQSVPSDTWTVTVDTVAPASPTLDSVVDDQGDKTGPIAPGDTTDDSQLDLKGTAEPGSTVIIYDNGVEIGRAPVAADGSWAFTPANPLGNGAHSLTVAAMDAAGNVSGATDPFDYTQVSDVAPGKPGAGTGGIDEAIDDVGPITGDIGNGGSTDDTTPTFGGSGLKPGETVTIFDNGVEIGQETVGADGTWHHTPDPALEDGTHSVTVTVTNEAGNTSEPSDPYDVIVDTVAPAAPTLDSVVDDQGDMTGAISPGDTTDDSQLDLKGTAEPGSIVIIYDKGVEIGRAPVAADGSWAFTPKTPLANGAHSLTVEAMDAAGNISKPTDPFDYKQLTGGAPPAPAITSVIDDVPEHEGNISPGGVTNDSHPDIVGTAQAGSTVSIFDNGVLLGTVVADVAGNWSFTPKDALNEGPHDLTANATNDAGNTSPTTGVYPIIVDTVSPAAAEASELSDNVGPITDPIVSGMTTDDNTPTYHGKAEANTTLVIYDKGVEIGRVPVNADGSWSFTPSPPLVDGAHSFSTVVIDEASNQSPESTPIDFTVDTSEVSISINQALDDVGPIQDPLASGGVTDDTTPTLTGSATPGSTVNIYLDGKLIQENVSVDASGKWTYTVSPALADGDYAFTATVVTAAGGESEPTQAFELEIDTTAPDKPVISDVYDDVGAQQGTVADGGSTDDTTPTLSGSGTAGDVIIIRDNGKEIGRETVGKNGQWSFTVHPPLNNGTYVFSVVEQDKAGNQSVPSDTWTVTVDTNTPNRPTLDSVVDDQGDMTGAISPGDITDDSQLDLKGTAEPGSTVIIYDNGVEIGRAPVAADGNWAFTPANPLGNGAHSLTVEAMDAAGNISEATHPFDYIQVSDVAPGKPGAGTGGIDEAIDDVGPITGDIGNGGSTDDTTPTFGGSGLKPGETVTIFDNGVEIGQETVGADGTWHHTPDPALEDGTHSVTVTVTNEAGNTSEPSDPYDVIVDTVAPASPTLDSVVDDQGDKTGPIAPGDTTDDSQLDLKGTAEPGSTVIIYDKGLEIGRAPVAADGSWTFTPKNPLANGLHSLTVGAMDAAGNISKPTDPFDYKQLTGGAPPAPAITSVIDDVPEHEGNISPGGATNDSHPEIVGTAQAGFTVSIFDNGVLLGTVVADVAGNWSFTPKDPLGEGRHDLTANATNDAGNTSPTTGVYPIIVDTVPPAAAEASELSDNVGPISDPIVSGMTTDDNTPTYHGKAEANTTLVIYDKGVEIGRVPVNADGSWSFTPSPPLVDGAHSFSTVVIDGASNQSPESTPIDFTVDTSEVSISINQALDDVGPIQDPLASGGVTDDTTPTLTGSATPGSTVNIYLDGKLIQENVSVDASGKWTYTVSPALADGDYAFTATVVTAAGGESEPTQAFELEIDTTAPDKPFISDVNDDVGDIQGTIIDGGSTDDTTPTLSGSGTAGDVIIIRDNGKEIGRETVDKDGKWSYTPNPPLNDGTYVFSVVEQDRAGNQSVPSDTWTVIVDTVITTPTLDRVWDDVGTPEELHSGDTTDDNQPDLSGKAEAGSTVTIYDNGVELGSVEANTQGEWSYTPDALKDGEHSFTLVAVDKAGNVSTESAPFELDVKTIASGFEDFESSAIELKFIEKSPYTFDSGLTIEVLSYGPVIHAGTPGIEQYNKSKTLKLVTGLSRIDFNAEVDAVSFRGSALQGNSECVFFNTKGKEIARETVTWGDDRHVSVTAPEGQQIAYMKISIGSTEYSGNYLYLDDIRWGSAEDVILPSAESTQSTSDESIFVIDGLTDDNFSAHGSESIDTLKLTGADQTLNLTELGNKVSSIEVIDITGTGENTLNLSLSDVLEQGETSLFTDDDHVQMMIKGDAGDVVNLDDQLLDGTDPGDWANQGTVTVAGVVYEVYQHSSLDAELLVQQGVTTNLV